MNHTPWPHIVIDNFLNKSQYAEILNEIRASINLSSLPERTIFVSTDEQFHIRFPKTLDIFNNIDFKSYLNLFPEIREHTTTDVYHEISIIKDGYEYPIHDENEKKILSCVLYLAPLKGTGTILYDVDKTYHSTVEWKPNRILIFAGLTGKTWHNYKTEPNTIRITINTFVTR